MLLRVGLVRDTWRRVPALVFGFGGVRARDGALSVAPWLPRAWASLEFPLRYRDRQLRVTLSHDEERYVGDEGEQVSLVIRGEERTAGQPLVLRP
jgi:trehalose/maltose hydrolase-like predicted phosphorylase